MTLTAPPPTTAGTPAAVQLWSTMPGWGITANLLPPEVLAGRRLAAVRKVIVIALLAVVALAIAGYGYAFFQQRSAQSELTAENNRTTDLMAQQQKYSEVVTIAGSIAEIKGHLATLLAADVDTTKLVEAVTSRLPNGSKITQLQVMLDAADAQASSSGSSSGGSSTSGGGGALDTSGQGHIGSLTLTGSAPALPDIAGYVNQLSTLPGVVGVFPTSQGTGTGDKGITFTLQMTLTDELLTHRYDVATTTPTGGK